MKFLPQNVSASAGNVGLLTEIEIKLRLELCADMVDELGHLGARASGAHQGDLHDQVEPHGARNCQPESPAAVGEVRSTPRMNPRYKLNCVRSLDTRKTAL